MILMFSIFFLSDSNRAWLAGKALERGKGGGVRRWCWKGKGIVTETWIVMEWKWVGGGVGGWPRVGGWVDFHLYKNRDLQPDGIRRKHGNSYCINCTCWRQRPSNNVKIAL
jgi:hypothetical protein